MAYIPMDHIANMHRYLNTTTYIKLHVKYQTYGRILKLLRLEKMLAHGKIRILFYCCSFLVKIRKILMLATNLTVLFQLHMFS